MSLPAGVRALKQKQLLPETRQRDWEEILWPLPDPTHHLLPVPALAKPCRKPNVQEPGNHSLQGQDPSLQPLPPLMQSQRNE